MTTSDPDAIRADIERTRAELSHNVDELTDTANPKNVANRQVDKMKDAVVGVKDKIMGSEDPTDRGGIRDGAADIGNAVSDAPRQVKIKTRGNPLAAGLVAFGVGLLISSLIPPSEKEQQVVSDLEPSIEPLKSEATAAAKEVAENLREPAESAVESIKTRAGESAQHVKEESGSAKDQIQGQATTARDTVQEHNS